MYFEINYGYTTEIDENIALGFTYGLVVNAAGVTYQTLNDWIKKGRNSTSGKYFEFYKHIKKCNADAVKALLERLNYAAAAGNCHVCMWILEMRLSQEFGRQVYRKTNVISENKNANVEIIVKDTDLIRKKILDKLSLIGEL